MSLSLPISLRRRAIRRAAHIAVATSVGFGLALAAAPAANAGIADWPASIDFSDPRGLSFDQARTTLYVADRDTQLISTVSEDGTVTPLVQTWNQLMGVAVLPDGDVLFTFDGTGNVYRVDADLLASTTGVLNLTSADVGTLVTIEFHASDPYLYGLAAGPDGTIYYSQYADKGVYAWSGGSSRLLFNAGQEIDALALTPGGDLMAADDATASYFVSSAQLAAGGSVTPALGALTGYVMGAAFFSDGVSAYFSDMDRVTKYASLPTLVAGTPSISGTTVVGSTITAATGTWPSGTTFTYRWLRNGVTIPDATAATYVLVAADAGAAVSVELRATNVGTDPSSRTVTATLAGTVTAAPSAGAPSTLTPAADTAATAQLAHTGFDGAPAGFAAIALLLLGSAAVILTRRRAKSS